MLTHTQIAFKRTLTVNFRRIGFYAKQIEKSFPRQASECVTRGLETYNLNKYPGDEYDFMPTTTVSVPASHNRPNKATSVF